jgi:hypothetical protein
LLTTARFPLPVSIPMLFTPPPVPTLVLPMLIS